MYGPSKQEYYITLGLEKLGKENTRAFWACLLVSKKIKVCKYNHSNGTPSANVIKRFLITYSQDK